jgi:hypothetical protein
VNPGGLLGAVPGLITGFVVAAVLAIGVLAVADALRGNSGDQERSAGATTAQPAGSPTLPEFLRREDVRGWFLYGDETCRLHSLSLPNLDEGVVFQEDGREYRQCRSTSEPVGFWFRMRLRVRMVSSLLAAEADMWRC